MAVDVDMDVVYGNGSVEVVVLERKVAEEDIAEIVVIKGIKGTVDIANLHQIYHYVIYWNMFYLTCSK